MATIETGPRRDGAVMPAVRSAGLHHVTAIAGDPKRNVTFYTEALGLRLVKKTVNFDDPGTYHLYYGDGTGSPGTIMTFFPWAGVQPGRAGVGQAVETAYMVPAASIGFWIARFLDKGIDHDAPVKRFGETVIAFRDPDGMHLELVGVPAAEALEGYAQAGVPAEHAIRGFAGQTIWVGRPDGTRRVLEDVFGYRLVAEEANRLRFVAEGGALGDRIDLRVVGGFPRGLPGAGTIHHIAFRAKDDTDQAAMTTALRGLGIGATEQMDRNYFRSVYFREPGGVIFEIATDTPGFAVDEPMEKLGEKLMLPAWLEANRREVEKALPALT